MITAADGGKGRTNQLNPKNLCYYKTTQGSIQCDTDIFRRNKTNYCTFSREKIRDEPLNHKTAGAVCQSATEVRGKGNRGVRDRQSDCEGEKKTESMYVQYNYLCYLGAAL